MCENSNNNQIDPEAIENWDWDRYRPWLRILAMSALPERLKTRVDASDIAQQTLAEAWKNNENYRGQSEDVKQAWLKGILKNIVSEQQRFHFGTAARSMDREQSIRHNIDQTSMRIEVFAAKDGSPSNNAAQKEQALLIAEILDQLPDDYRQVISLRHFEELSHEETASRLGRSPAAVRMLWIRALAALKKEMGVHRE